MPRNQPPYRRKASTRTPRKRGGRGLTSSRPKGRPTGGDRAEEERQARRFPSSPSSPTPSTSLSSTNEPAASERASGAEDGRTAAIQRNMRRRKKRENGKVMSNTQQPTKKRDKIQKKRPPGGAGEEGGKHSGSDQTHGKRTLVRIPISDALLVAAYVLDEMPPTGGIFPKRTSKK